MAEGYLCIENVCTRISDLSKEDQKRILQLDQDGDGNVCYKSTGNVGDTMVSAYYNSSTGMLGFEFPIDIADNTPERLNTLKEILNYRQVSIGDNGKISIWVTYETLPWRERRTNYLTSDAIPQTISTLVYLGLLPERSYPGIGGRISSLGLPLEMPWQKDNATLIIRHPKYSCNDYDSCFGRRLVSFAICSTIVLQNELPDDFRSLGLLADEATRHLLTSFIKGKEVPWWFSEGLAFFAREKSTWSASRSRRSIRETDTRDLIVDYEKHAGEYFAFKFGYEKDPKMFFMPPEGMTNDSSAKLFFSFILKKYPHGTIQNIIWLLQYYPFEKAFKVATNDSLESFFKEFYAYAVEEMTTQRKDTIIVPLPINGTNYKILYKKHQYDEPILETQFQNLGSAITEIIREHPGFFKDKIIGIDMDRAKEGNPVAGYPNFYYPWVHINPSALDDSSKLKEEISKALGL